MGTNGKKWKSRLIGVTRGSRDPFSEFWDPLRISGIVEASNSKFEMLMTPRGANGKKWKIRSIGVTRHEWPTFGIFGPPLYLINGWRYKIEIRLTERGTMEKCKIASKAIIMESRDLLLEFPDPVCVCMADATNCKFGSSMQITLSVVGVGMGFTRGQIQILWSYLKTSLVAPTIRTIRNQRCDINGLCSQSEADADYCSAVAAVPPITRWTMHVRPVALIAGRIKFHRPVVCWPMESCIIATGDPACSGRVHQ